MASVIAGILLVIPVYLVARELVGSRAAWIACVLTYIAPVFTNVMADVLSEGTFLLFWTWGVWAALRFLKDGRFLWLTPMIAATGLAYFTRPEGVLLPAVMVTTLCVHAFTPLDSIAMAEMVGSRRAACNRARVDRRSIHAA